MSKKQSQKISNSVELIAALKKYDLEKNTSIKQNKALGGNNQIDPDALAAFENDARKFKNNALTSFLQEKPLVSNKDLLDILQNFDKDQKLEVTKNILAKTKPDQDKSALLVADILKQFDKDEDKSEVLKLLHARTPLKKLTTAENQSIVESFKDSDAAKSALSAINPPSLFSQITDRIKKLFAPEKKYVFDTAYAKSPNEKPDIVPTPTTPSTSIKATSVQNMPMEETREAKINPEVPSAAPKSPSLKRLMPAQQQGQAQ